jgi:hypothetical protein
MRDIQKADIIGARIVDIHEAYKLSAGGLDMRQIYFTVDRGFTFITPIAGLRWTSVELPNNAKRLPDEFVNDKFAVKRGWFERWRFTRLSSTKVDTVGQIKQLRISGVYCAPFDEKLGFHYPDDGIIIFDDGSQASNTVVAPHGTGGAGLYFFSAESGRCTPLEQLVDYFTIPLEKSDA